MAEDNIDFELVVSTSERSKEVEKLKTPKSDAELGMLNLSDNQISQLNASDAQKYLSAFDNCGYLNVTDATIKDKLKKKIGNNKAGKERSPGKSKENEFKIERGDIIDYMYDKWLLAGAGWCLQKFDKYARTAANHLIAGIANAREDAKKADPKTQDTETMKLYRKTMDKVDQINQQRLNKVKTSFNHAHADLDLVMEHYDKNGNFNDPEFLKAIEDKFGKSFAKTLKNHENEPEIVNKMFEGQRNILKNKEIAARLSIYHAGELTILAMTDKKVNDVNFGKEWTDEEFNNIVKTDLTNKTKGVSAAINGAFANENIGDKELGKIMEKMDQNLYASRLTLMDSIRKGKTDCQGGKSKPNKYVKKSIDQMLDLHKENIEQGHGAGHSKLTEYAISDKENLVDFYKSYNNIDRELTDEEKKIANSLIDLEINNNTINRELKDNIKDNIISNTGGKANVGDVEIALNGTSNEVNPQQNNNFNPNSGPDR